MPKLADVLIQGLADAAAILDSDLSLVSFNYAFVMLSGIKRRELETRLAQRAKAYDLFDSKDGALRAAARAVLAEGRELRLDGIAVVGPVGQQLAVMATLIPFQEVDSPRLILILRDVSDEVRMQEKYKELLAAERVRADELERQVEQRTSALRTALEQVTRLSHTDALTGVANRRAFTDSATHALQLAQRHGRTLALVFFDLDHFKRLNDTWGHQAGDAVLMATAKVLSETIRRTDLLARFGGEEFMILLNETHEEKVSEVVERCLQRVRELPMGSIIPGSDRVQTLSAGIALYPKHGSDLDALVRSADRALYHSKAMGRNQVSLFDVSMDSMQPAGRVRMPRVLLVGDDRPVLEARASALRGRFETFCSSDFDQALDLTVWEQMDAVVVDHDFNKDRGLELLGTALVVHPQALRVLVTSSPQSYAAIRRTASTGADLFLLTADARDKLSAALEDGLTHQEVSRRSGPPPAFLARRFPEDLVRRVDILLETGGMRAAYQPIFDTRTRKVFAHEAFSRADDPALRDPQVLFDGAVMCGRIWKLSRLARARAVSALDRLPENQLLFLNLHPAEVEDPQLLVDPALRPWAHRIVLELTERAAVPDLVRFRKKMEQLRALGFRFAVDDLGAGYASLNSVALLEPDFVKLDKETVSAVAESPRLRTLVRRIIEFANESDIQVVGEGVEREEELQALAEVGCHLVQGFLLGLPSAGFYPADALKPNFQ